MKENDINQLCNVYDLCKSELIADCVQASEKDVQEWWKSCQKLLHSEKSDFRTKEKVVLMLTKLLAEKSELLEKIEKLETEVAEFRERLDKAIEPPVKIGDTIHTVIKNCVCCQHYHASWAECRAPATAHFDCESTHGTCFTQDIIDDECKKHLCVAKLEFDLRLLDPKTGELKPQYFIDEKVAEAKLKDLQGGRSNGTYKREKPNNKEIS